MQRSAPIALLLRFAYLILSADAGQLGVLLGHLAMHLAQPG